MDKTFGTSRRTVVGAAVALTLILTQGPGTGARKGKRRPRTTARCADPLAGSSGQDGFVRLAQVFSPSRAGVLRRIEVDLRQGGGGGASYLVQVVTATGGVPGHRAIDVLAATVALAPDPEPDAFVLKAAFAGPRLEVGTDYAVVVSCPASISYAVAIGSPDRCGRVFGANGSDPGGAFSFYSLNNALQFAVFVS